MGKVTRAAPIRGISRRKRPVILPKPFGFCCSPERQPSGHESVDPAEKRRTPLPVAALSLGSIHECPALKLRLQVTSKRPPVWTEGPDGKRVPSIPGAPDPGGLLADTTQSSIDLVIEMMRKQRQNEYEKQMDLWAEIGEKKTMYKNRRLKCEGRPYWYAEYSFEQLRELKQLEDVLFKDKKQKSINRTKHALEALGAINELKKVEPKVLAKLIREYSTEPVKFLCEIYKATNGMYPGEETYSCTYDPSMRIIMSGIAFLELPDIIIELHKILPPVIKYPLPAKPTKPTVILPKKAAAPLLQKLVMPPNYRLYKQQTIEWERKCREMRRPMVILPKMDKLEQLAQKKQGEKAKLRNNKTSESSFMGKKPEPPQKEEEKRLSKNSKLSRGSTGSRISRGEEEDGEVYPEDEFEGEDEYPSKNEFETAYDKEDVDTGTLSKSQVHQIEWTDPPSRCPYKYLKLMTEQGPLKENEAFFAALRPAQRVRTFPEGRENLSLGLQTYLLEVEADMHPLQAQASQLLDDVRRLAREILESGPQCEPCCSCRQTRRSHLLWHSTPGPHNVIEGVIADGRDQRQVIGSTAMHSPASSVSANSVPPCVPSKETLVKERVLGGYIVDEDGQPVRHVEAVSRMPEHVPRRELRPDSDVEVIRNVPPCGCNERREQRGQGPQEELDLNAMAKGKDEGLCYGAKFRPREGPAYQCGANDPPDDGSCCCVTDRPDSTDNVCACDEFLPLEMESYEGEESVESSSEVGELPERVKKGFKFCIPCGKRMYPCSSSLLDKDNKEICSCDSLSEFLQLDLCKVKCEKPPKEAYKRKSTKKDGPELRTPSSRKEVPSVDSKKSELRKTLNKEKQEEENVIELDDDRRTSKRQSMKKNGENTEDSDENGIPRKSDTDSSSNLEKSEKILNSNKPKKLEKPAKSEKPAKPEKLKKPSKPAKSSQLDKIKVTESDEPFPAPRCPEDTGPPFGDRTKSEENLPTELTVAYLVDRHPPDFPTEQVPVREGGRPCRCRENRNNRKKLIYGIGNTTAGEPAAALIEGVAWLTPVPSLRRSEEYIPDYDVYDSPYGCKVCDAGKPAREAPADAAKIRRQRDDDRKGRAECALRQKEENKREEGEEMEESESTTSTETEVIWDRSKDWNNAMKDDYLTDFYGNKLSGVPCWKRCARGTEPRRLRVTKPVCECRYERKIVKREEERRRWRERKKRLQSLPKEEFLRVSDVAVLPIERHEEEVEEPALRCSCSALPPAPTEEPVHVIEGIAVQTPCATPSRRRSCDFTNLPFQPPCGQEAQEKPAEPEPAPKENSQPSKKKRTNAPRGRRRKSNSFKGGNTEERNVELTVGKPEEEKSEKLKLTEKTKKPAPKLPESPSTAALPAVQERVPKKRRRTSFLNRPEHVMMDTVRKTLEKMDDNKFISVKFPDYSKMPQIAYWVSYRVKGMNFTREFRRLLLIKSRKLWESKKQQGKPLPASSIKITKSTKDKLNFGYIRYWKQKIAKKKLDYYMNVRKQIVDLGRNEWFNMEFGKFPNVSFKEAYFTYMPTKERDTVAFRPWFPT